MINLKLTSLTMFCALALLISACGKERALSEQVSTPLSLEMSYECDAFNEETDTLPTGKIRYIIRTFPVGCVYNKVKPSQEFTIVRDINGGYDHSVTLDFHAGEYDVMVWSDLIQDGELASCHNAENFGDIHLAEGCVGNNIYRDAFRGTARVSVPKGSDTPIELKVDMQRPLAKYEIVSDDLAEFISCKLSDGEDFNIEDYTAIVYYIGYMPNSYSIYSDKPVDATTGVMFTSPLSVISETQVSLGFDYVFVPNKESSTTVKIGVYDNKGTLISMSQSVNIPLQRNKSTVKHGEYLTSKTSDGIDIDKEFEGSFDLTIK